MKIMYFLVIFCFLFSCNKTTENKEVEIDKNHELKMNLLEEEYGASIYKRLTDEERNFIYEITGSDHAKYCYDYFVVLLENKNILCKINSIDKNYFNISAHRNLVGIDPEVDYNIIFIDSAAKTFKTIATDKYFNLKLLPVIYNKTRQNSYDGDDTIYTTWNRCFILQTITAKIYRDNIYKLIYIDNTNKNFVQKEYEYRSSKFPEYIYITITPNYFIIEHFEMEGEEFILLNRETGEYKIIDTETSEGH